MNRYDEIYHFGVKGMKWGVRRAVRKNEKVKAATKRYSDDFDDMWDAAGRTKTFAITKRGKEIKKQRDDEFNEKYARMEKSAKELEKVREQARKEATTNIGLKKIDRLAKSAAITLSKSEKEAEDFMRYNSSLTKTKQKNFDNGTLREKSKILLADRNEHTYTRDGLTNKLIRDRITRDVDNYYKQVEKYAAKSSKIATKYNVEKGEEFYKKLLKQYKN